MKNRGMSGISGLPGTVVRAKFQAVRTAHLGLSSKLLAQKYEEPRQIRDPAFSGLLEPPRPSCEHWSPRATILWWPWAPSAHRMLQEAFKTGFPDLG